MRDVRKWLAPLTMLGLLALLLAPAVGCDRERETEVETPAGETEIETETDATTGETEEVEIEHDSDDADMALDDAGITASVKTKLLADERVSALQIDVDTDNKVVTLKGSVPTEQAKSAAEEVARGTEGVTDVVNMLTVGGEGQGS